MTLRRRWTRRRWTSNASSIARTSGPAHSGIGISPFQSADQRTAGTRLRSPFTSSTTKCQTVYPMASGSERGPRLPKTVCAPSSACTFEDGPSGSPWNARTRAWSGNWRRVLEDESTCMFEDGRLFHVLNTLQLRDNAGESAAAPKHGFESRWGHQIVYV